MTDWAELIRALAALLWPIFAFVTLSMFKPELRRILQRLRKGKVLGQEIELEDSLERLESIATAAESQVAALSIASGAPRAPGPR